MEESVRRESTFDSASFIQLLQNNNEDSNRKKKRIIKSPLTISVIILYGIVGVLILHLTISSSLRENYLKSVIKTHQPQRSVQAQKYDDKSYSQEDSHKDSKYSMDIKVLQHEISLLKIQIKSLKISLQSRSANSSKFGVKKELDSTNVGLLNMTWTVPKIILQIKSVSENLEHKIGGVQRELNSSTHYLETRIQMIESQMNSVKLSNKILNETSETLLKRFEKKTNHQSPEGFVNSRDLIVEPIGTNVKNDTRIMNVIRNRAIRELKSCNDYKKLGISDDGFYEINLERNTDKFSTVRVYCNFTSDMTILYHNETKGANVSVCSNSSCFEHHLSYPASREEIQTLINTSDKCEQSIRFRCFHAHLENYGSWYDAHGEKQSYYTGSNYGKHICSCFNTKTGCSGLSFINKCNCDASLLPSWLEDTGTITNKTALPISKFTYGHLLGKGQQEAYIQIGPLKCTGNKNYDPKKDCEAFNSPGYRIFEGEEDRFNISYCNHMQKKTKTSELLDKRPFAVISYGEVKSEEMGYNRNSLTVSVSGDYLTDCYSGTRNDGYYYRNEHDSLCDELKVSKVQHYNKGENINISKAKSNKIYRIIMLTKR